MPLAAGARVTRTDEILGRRLSLAHAKKDAKKGP
jgi:hypothetical protein